MSTTPVPSKETTSKPTAATVDMKLEVIIIAVSDVERATTFGVSKKLHNFQTEALPKNAERSR